MVGHCLAGRKPEEFAQRKGVGTAPADAVLGIDALEVADQKHAEIAPRRNRPAAEFFGIEGRTELFEEGVKCFLAQELLFRIRQKIRYSLYRTFYLPLSAIQY